EDDSPALATLHRDAWRYAYAGIIPGPTIERMVARRGPRWWREMHASGGRALVVELEGLPVGYATMGRSRARGGIASRPGGEIYELYLRPECQGVGIGRQLFEATRGRLTDAGYRGTFVWSLADNALGCRFYRAMGGTQRSRCRERLGGVALYKVGFAWD